MNELEKINKLLQNDINLEKYINEIQEKKVDTPEDLKDKIFSKINQKKKSKYADICKIAACLIFSLAVCRMDFIKNDNITTKEERPKTTISINEKLSDFCKWVTTPLEIEKEEK